MADNKLFYGDNLDVLRRYVRDESVDLIYLDPPFNSRQDYNVLFAEKDGTRSSSQITAFEDTWEWNLDAERAYQEGVERGGWVVEAFGTFSATALRERFVSDVAQCSGLLLLFDFNCARRGTAWTRCHTANVRQLSYRSSATTCSTPTRNRETQGQNFQSILGYRAASRGKLSCGHKGDACPSGCRERHA